MRHSILLVPLLLLAACDKPTPPAERSGVASSGDDVAAQLATQPAKLADLRRRCRSTPGEVGADTCAMVARATRIQLTQSGPSAYAPGVVSGASGNEVGR